MFRDLVLARIIEPTSKLDSARVLEEVGVPAAGYATVKRRLPVFATPAFPEEARRGVRAAVRAGSGEPGAL